MPIVLKEVSGPQIPTGVHLGICFRIADVGTQPPSNGYPSKRKIILSFEFPHERSTFDGVEKPLVTSKWYTCSLGKKATLRKDLQAWRGRAFTPEELLAFNINAVLGKPCQISIATNENNKVGPTSIVGIPKGMQVPHCFNPLCEFSVDDGKDTEAYKALPEWLRDVADKCLEWTGGLEEAKVPDLVTDIPAPADDDASVPF